jgi:glycosyltransferase involved in cell wall biosynthesis
MEAACFRLADAVVSSSACSARWCLEHYHSRADEIPVIHSGVDTELFAPRAIAKAKRPAIVFVGRVVWNKGVFALLDAACKLRGEFPDLTLHLIGPADQDVLRQLEGKSRRFPGLLEHTAEVGREELSAHLSRAHVFAAPSLYEGGPGFVYLEAMACGLPVIGCSGSGVAEVVEPSETGFLVPPGDADALGAALRELLADPARRRAMGAKARRYVLENARREECLRRLETFYRTVAARSARTVAVEASVQDSAPRLAVR